MLTRSSPSPTGLVTTWLLLSLVLASASIAQPEALFASGCGWFGETGMPPLQLGDPDILVRSDGSVIVARENGRWIGQMKSDKLEKLASYLSGHKLLQKSQMLENVRGDYLLIEGGLCYLDLWVAGRVVVATLVRPTKGPWRRLLDRVERALPGSWARWNPATDEVDPSYQTELQRILDRMAWEAESW